MWIFENFYWILIIGFAVISALSKSGKSRKNQNPRGMPTFGDGGRDYRQDRSSDREFSRGRREEETSSVSEPIEEPYPYELDSDTQRHYTDSNEDIRPAPDYDTGEGVSRMWDDERPKPKKETLEDRQRMMQRDIDKVNASLDKISSTMDATSLKTTTSGSQQPVSPLAEEARQGMIWSEILGAPRSKRGYHNRK